LRDQAVFGFAGLYDVRRQGDGWQVSCGILTTAPSELVAQLHDRMPVILPPDAERLWLDPEASLPELLDRCLQPYPHALMDMLAVVPLVNDVRNEGSELRTPAPRNMAEPEQQQLL
jgi:putative SOS response-associated peptidase YedK